MTTLTARWVFPVAGPPLPGGTVTVADGRVVAVEPHGRTAPTHDLGDAAIIPGLVNAHTHLDLSGMRGLVPPSADFTGWLKSVIGHRRSTTPERAAADVRAGLAEALRFGTTLVGDIAAGGASWDALDGAPAWAVCFHELIGLSEDRAAAALEAFWWWHRALPESANCRVGVSPHAPYSARFSLFAAGSYALGLPLATHLAESEAELELLASRSGPFKEFLVSVGAWSPDGLVKRAADVLSLTAGVPPAVYAHGNFLTAADPVPANGTVVYCPRTHAAFGRPPHPFRELLAAGVRVALGTDSLASNPDLDVLTEARFVARRHPDVPAATVLRMATLSGAEALGFSDVTGSLEPGKSADLAVVPVGGGTPDDPHGLLWESDEPVRATMWRGAWR